MMFAKFVMAMSNTNQPEPKPEEQRPAKDPKPSLPGPREMPDVEVEEKKAN